MAWAAAAFVAASPPAEPRVPSPPEPRGATPATSPYQPSSVADVRDQAEQLVAAGRWQEAIEVLAEVPGERPDPEVLLLLARAQRGLGDLTAARRCALQAVQLRDNAAGHFELGQIYLAGRSFALAIEQFQLAARQGGPSGALHFALATAFYEAGTYLGSVQATAAPDAAAGTCTDQGYLLEPVADRPGFYWTAPPDSAVYHVHRALSAGQSDVAVRLLQARIWLRARKFAPATQLLARLDGDIPAADRASWLRDYAAALYGVDDVEGYVARMEQALLLEASAPAAERAAVYQQAAGRYAQRGDLVRYIEFLEKAVAEQPESADLHYLLGNGLWEAGRKVPASRQWRIALQIRVDHPDRERMLELIGQAHAGG